METTPHQTGSAPPLLCVCLCPPSVLVLSLSLLSLVFLVVVVVFLLFCTTGSRPPVASCPTGARHQTVLFGSWYPLCFWCLLVGFLGSLACARLVLYARRCWPICARTQVSPHLSTTSDPLRRSTTPIAFASDSLHIGLAVNSRHRQQQGFRAESTIFSACLLLRPCLLASATCCNSSFSQIGVRSSLLCASLCQDLGGSVCRARPRQQNTCGTAFCCPFRIFFTFLLLSNVCV